MLIFFIVFFCLKIFFTLLNSVDPDEMQHYAAFHLGLHCLHPDEMQHNAAFHLGLHCLQKYSFRSYPNTKG